MSAVAALHRIGIDVAFLDRTLIQHALILRLHGRILARVRGVDGGVLAGGIFVAAAAGIAGILALPAAGVLAAGLTGMYDITRAIDHFAAAVVGHVGGIAVATVLGHRAALHRFAVVVFDAILVVAVDQFAVGPGIALAVLAVGGMAPVIVESVQSFAIAAAVGIAALVRFAGRFGRRVRWLVCCADHAAVVEMGCVAVGHARRAAALGQAARAVVVTAAIAVTCAFLLTVTAVLAAGLLADLLPIRARHGLLPDGRTIGCSEVLSGLSVLVTGRAESAVVLRIAADTRVRLPDTRPVGDGTAGLYGIDVRSVRRGRRRSRITGAGRIRVLRRCAGGETQRNDETNDAYETNVPRHVRFLIRQGRRRSQPPSRFKVSRSLLRRRCSLASKLAKQPSRLTIAQSR